MCSATIAGVQDHAVVASFQPTPCQLCGGHMAYLHEHQDSNSKNMKGAELDAIWVASCCNAMLAFETAELVNISKTTSYSEMEGQLQFTSPDKTNLPSLAPTRMPAERNTSSVAAGHLCWSALRLSAPVCHQRGSTHHKL